MVKNAIIHVCELVVVGKMGWAMPVKRVPVLLNADCVTLQLALQPIPFVLV